MTLIKMHFSQMVYSLSTGLLTTLVYQSRCLLAVVVGLFIILIAQPCLNRAASDSKLIRREARLQLILSNL